MKRTKLCPILLIAILILSMFLFTGCGDKSGDTIDEPEITADYLTEEYVTQLTDDGAGTIMGSVELEKKAEDSYIAHISEKEVVPNSNYDDGYYIADTNIGMDAKLGSGARLTCYSDGNLEVVTADEFIENSKASTETEQVYMIYMMSDSVELILAVDPKDYI